MNFPGLSGDLHVLDESESGEFPDHPGYGELEFLRLHSSYDILQFIVHAKKPDVVLYSQGAN
jgi:hypothetical protein